MSEQENKLRRQNGIIGGVCGGLGSYFNVDPVWNRAPRDRSPHGKDRGARCDAHDSDRVVGGRRNRPGYMRTMAGAVRRVAVAVQSGGPGSRARR